MNAPKSLSEFFTRTDRTTLDNCDSEQIHFSGMIQNIGALIALDQDSYRVVAASENISDFLGVAPEAMMSMTLADLDPELHRELALLSNGPQLLHEVLDYIVTREGVSFDTVTHCHAGLRIIEFLPNNMPSPRVSRTNMRLVGKTSAQILHSDSFEDAMQIAVDAVRSLTGFARVKIYRFLPDWSGETIAESRVPEVDSYLGLHFPAGDIPKQVREIMTMVPYRAIGSVFDDAIPIRVLHRTGGPIDLTWAVSRSVSRMHTAYLRNMGLQASFGCSLMHRGALWGLIAAHHTEPGIVPFDSWSLIHEIGTALMLRHDQHERTKIADKITELRRIENAFAAALRNSGEVEDVVATLVPVLQEFLDADGFAFQYGSNLHFSGRTPPPDIIREMIQWAIKQRETSDQFQTTAFHRDFPPARDHMDTACGVLIQPIATHRVCQLIWFRGPITQKVAWAGKPRKAAVIVPDADPVAQLLPRQSFARWEEEHCEESKPWMPDELESAREIFKEFLDIVTAQLLLKDENATLKKFAATAAHDLRAPLRGISNALSFMHEDGFEPEAVRENHAMAKIYAARLTDLTSGLLELEMVTGQKHSFTDVDPTRAARDARDLLGVQIEEAEADFEIAQMPLVRGNLHLLMRLFLNLGSNALKYRDPDRAPRVRIGPTEGPAGFQSVEVCDNGIGIPEEYAKRVFQAMQRLHPQSKIEGSGLGLSICERIVQQHGGKISLDTAYSGGARFVVSLPNPVRAEHAA
ncbi:Bacteriophytochrome (light-regulated signal transduction histidine kinase) [Roseivivax lentus]|uniref:histidine kinase n=1 Tax=Roseivivax lentus TaxID=633194 RepID=A0A1N7PXU2_9RHOB|nr:ATP-binding protein [Roseivivax lentus]SIT15412.1 Bacteriophytochrome (light-regulated signal transduction histidine kinase) [Roseivivax lentus]